MHFGFSYIGLIFLILLFVPNILWTKHKPEGYDTYAAKENRILLRLERVGQVAVCCLVLIFSDFNWQGPSLWGLWLLAACLCMTLYEIFWVCYFRSTQTMGDFYRSLLGIPVAGASLPVMAFLCLGIYGRNICLILAVIVLGIGHIGIHLGHKKEIQTINN